MKSLRAPLLLFVLPAVLLAFAPTRQPLFLLDRSAVEAGEFWRLWSGHWAHFSQSHLGWNLVVLLAAGFWLECLRPGLLLRYTLVAPPLISLALLVGEPRLQAYGGLSGLATGVIVLLGLHQLGEAHSPRGLGVALLALVAGKAIYDLTHSDALLVNYATTEIRTSSFGHAAGALAALSYFVSGHVCRVR